MDHKLNLEIFGDLPEKDYDDLKEDIKLRGIQDPLHIRKTNDKYQVISGHQRKKIAIELDLKVVPCIIRDDLKEEWEVEEHLLKDNLLRRQLNDSQIAKASMRLLLIEKEKAKQRQGERTDLKHSGNISTKSRDKKKSIKSRDVVASQFGISGRQLEKIQYVSKNLSGNDRKEWETGRLSTNGAYNKIKESNKKEKDLKQQVENESKTESVPVFNRSNENIEWARWSWNPYTGCKHNCSYCYAHDIAVRFYKQGFEPTFHENRLVAPDNTKISAKEKDILGIHNVFVCSMADLFGDWVDSKHIQKIIDAVKKHKDWNFLFLTKNPKRLLEFKFPDNAWVGTTIDYQKRVKPAEDTFRKIKAKIKFVSCEPLKEKINFNDLSVFDWLIIGGQSKSSREPEFQPDWIWVESLLNQARKNNVKVYFKPNLTVRPKEYPTGVC